MEKAPKQWLNTTEDLHSAVCVFNVDAACMMGFQF